MLRRRLTIRFTLQMIIVTLLLIIVAAFIFAWMFNELEEIEIQRNFAPTGISKLIDEASIDEQGHIVNDRLVKLLEQNGGWLQRLDEQGNVLQSFFTPEDVPHQYNPAQLIDYWTGTKPFPYDTGLWIQPKGDDLFIMLYGIEKPLTNSPLPYIQQATIDGDSIIFADTIEQELSDSQYWIQVLNAAGEEIAAWNKPPNAVSHLTLSELALRNIYPERYGAILQSYYEENSSLTWIFHSPLRQELANSAPVPDVHAELRVVIIGLIAFLIAAFVTMLTLAFGYASLFIRPVFQLMRWIQQLRNHELEITAANAKAKRKKHLFKEVKEEIDQLAVALVENKKAAAQTQVYREEWIAGVTHDMRTPLSSIQGYAHMLAAQQYSWSEEETRSFASIILEKTQYMDQLIEDLSLTYRLRSGSLPVVMERQHINALLQDILERVAANYAYDECSITCYVPDVSIYQDIHPPWFERSINNLIVNAVLHNASYTNIKVTLQSLEQGWAIHIEDDGIGMDEHTMNQLFERYYRGTNTEQSIVGSGLGMAITKELIQAMGGAIQVSSQPQRGSTISLLWNSQQN